MATEIRYVEYNFEDDFGPDRYISEESSMFSEKTELFEHIPKNFTIHFTEEEANFGVGSYVSLFGNFYQVVVKEILYDTSLSPSEEGYEDMYTGKTLRSFTCNGLVSKHPNGLYKVTFEHSEYGRGWGF